MSERTRITTSTDLEDLREGERCEVIATLTAMSHGGQAALLLTCHDWTQIPVRVNVPSNVPRDRMRRRVRVLCTWLDYELHGEVLFDLADVAVPVPLTTVPVVSGNLT